jgi:hypothetical protein
MWIGFTTNTPGHSAGGNEVSTNMGNYMKITRFMIGAAFVIGMASLCVAAATPRQMEN